MNEIDYIPIAALNHYAYCPHRCWRMFCAGEFQDNQYTIEGTSLHDRFHTFKHPVLKRQCTYQESFEIQARLMAKYLMGEIDKYPPLILK